MFFVLLFFYMKRVASAVPPVLTYSVFERCPQGGSGQCCSTSTDLLSLLKVSPGGTGLSGL